MSIKTKETIKGTIKTIDKGRVITDKAKDTIVSIKEKGDVGYNNTNDNNANEYAINRINNSVRNLVNNSGNIKNTGNKTVRDTKNNFIKTKNKVKNIKTKLTEKKMIKQVKNKIKTSKKVVKETAKTTKQTIKASERAKQLMVKSVKMTYQGIKVAVKATVSAIKGIIAGTKALISFLLAGGWIALIIIIVICLIGVLLNSHFGIFFSGEKTSKNSITMQDVIAECNNEFYDKLQTIQDENEHEEYVLEGKLASWKDMLVIYTVKVSKGINENDVITIDDNKKQIMKDIFWDMNSLSSEVKTETIIEQGVNTDELPTEIEKEVLHIIITSKNAEQMKEEYSFNELQLEQYNELLSDEYSSLWNGIIYSIDSGEYTTWRQSGASWSNIKIGNTTSTIGQIGCLVTSIAVLIEKSEVENKLVPFNPGVFVEELNKNNGFDNKGNLQYSAISKVVPNFKYMGIVDLKNRTRTEKLSLIKEYVDRGYYLAVEVKGATEGNQHWVAITDVEGNNIYIVDPASNYTELWPSYDWDKTTQFIYFKVKV
jgi:hypothetical protein